MRKGKRRYGMSEFRVDYRKLKNSATTVKGVSNTLDTYIRSLDDVVQKLHCVNSGVYGAITSTIKGIESELAQLKKESKKMGEVLEKTADTYKTTESKIVGDTVQASNSFIKMDRGYSTNNTDTYSGIISENGMTEARSGASASVWTEHLSIDMFDGFNKADTSRTALGAEAYAMAGHSNNLFNLAAYATAGASAYVYKEDINASTFWGLNRFDASGEVLSANAGADVSFSNNLFRKPDFGAGAFANAQVAKGEFVNTIGTDKDNIFAEAEGGVLEAEAYAEVRNGIYTDEDGDTVFGRKASVGVGAYLAEGEVTGGFTMGGIKMSASIGGEVGVGANAEFELNNESLRIGGQFATWLGLKGDVEIDWSGVEKIDWSVLRFW